MTDNTPKSNMKLDLRAEVCPFSFIQTRLALEQMAPGEVLEVRLRGAAVENVPHRAEEEGHKILRVVDNGGDFTFFIRKAAEFSPHACAQRDCLNCRDTLREAALENKKSGSVKMKGVIEEVKVHAERLEDAAPEEILRWSLEYFGDRVALASSFGAEDMVITDMLANLSQKARIFTLDTGRLHQETYDVIEATKKKYGIDIEVFCPAARELEELTREFGPNLFYESIENRITCCRVRKINPLRRALAGLDAWICGLRREQSPTRSDVRKIEIGGDDTLKVKINPLADWPECRVWDYIKKHKVPYNRLHDQGFPSIGCSPCTRALGEGEDIRAGRWWWEDPERKECGLHKGK